MQQIQQRIGNLNTEYNRVFAQRDRVLQELTTGDFCSKCEKSRMEIEAGGEEFYAHLRDVNGQRVRAPDAVIARRRNDFANLLRGIEQQRQTANQSLQRQVTDCQNEQNRLRQAAYERQREQEAAQRQATEARRREQLRQRRDGEAAAEAERQRRRQQVADGILERQYAVQTFDQAVQSVRENVGEYYQNQVEAVEREQQRMERQFEAEDRRAALIEEREHQARLRALAEEERRRAAYAAPPAPRPEAPVISPPYRDNDVAAIAPPEASRPATLSGLLDTAPPSQAMPESTGEGASSGNWLDSAVGHTQAAASAVSGRLSAMAALVTDMGRYAIQPLIDEWNRLLPPLSPQQEQDLDLFLDYTVKSLSPSHMEDVSNRDVMAPLDHATKDVRGNWLDDALQPAR